MKTLAILLLSILPFICSSAPYQPNRYDTNTDSAAVALVAAQAAAAAQAATNNYAPIVTNVVNGILQGAPIGVPQNPLNAGLLLDLSFIEGQGTNIYNYAGSYATPGYTPNASCTMVGGQYLWQAGQLGNALSMTNSGLNVGNGSLGSFTNYLQYTLGTNINGGSNFTASIWVNQPTFGGDYSVPFALIQPASPNCSFELFYTAAQTGFYFFNSQTNETYNYVPSYADGNWHQLAAVYSGTNVALCVDGLVLTNIYVSGPLPAASSTAPILYIGATRVGGAVQKCQFWDRALSSNEMIGNFLSQNRTGRGFYSITNSLPAIGWTNNTGIEQFIWTPSSGAAYQLFDSANNPITPATTTVSKQFIPIQPGGSITGANLQGFIHP